MKMEAMKRRGYRSDLDANDSTSGTEFPKSDKWSRDIVGSEAGMTGRQVTKYIRLTELIPELLDYVDIKKITIAMAVDLSYLDEQVQKWVYEYFKENGFLKPVQVEALKNYPNLSNVTQFSVISIMNDALPKKSKESKLSFSAKKLDKYFPPQYSTKEREKYNQFSYWNSGVQIRYSQSRNIIMMFQKCRNGTSGTGRRFKWKTE